MSATLKEFKECCRSLVTEKVTERRKQIQSMMTFLGNGIVLEWLNTNSTTTVPTGLTWNHVFKSARNCWKMEIASLEKDSLKTTLSASMLTAQDRRKKECVGLIKVVVTKANSGLPKLNTSSLVDHLLHVLQSDQLRQHFMVDYASIVEKHVVGNQAVMRDLKQTDYFNFVRVFVEVYQSLKAGANFSLPLQILDGLARQSPSLASLDGKLLFNFYRDAIRNSKELNLSGSQQSALLSACNSFCTLAAPDCRLQLCHLGEEVIDILLSLLDNSCIKQLRSSILRFLSLQMSCHHPGGATGEDEGMVVLEAAQWRRSLHRLYGLLRDQLQSTATASSSKTRFLEQVSGNSNETTDLLELLVEVSRQEFAIRTCEEDEEGGGAAKRRRLDRGLDSVVDRLQSLGADSDVSTRWLLFLSTLLRKYPDSISTREQFVRILQVLNQFQLDCKRYSNMSGILECLATCCDRGWPRPSSAAPATDPLLRPYWIKVYDAAVRTVTVNQCVQEAHSVIRTLIERELVTARSELQGLFVPGVAPPSPHAIRTLAVILRRGDITKFSSSSVVHRRWERSSLDATDVTVDMRIQLLEWLLPDSAKETTTMDSRLAFDGHTVELIGEILACLALRDSSVIHVPNSDTTSTTGGSTENLETSYLRATFCDVVPEVSPAKKPDAVASGKCFVLSAVKNKILECLHRDCACLLDPSLSTRSDNVAVVALQCCLVMKLLGSAIRHEVLLVSDLARGPLCDILQRLMLKLSQDARTLHQRDNTPAKAQTTLSMVTWLQRLTSWRGDVDYCRIMSQFCREMFSDRLVAFLVDLTYEGVHRATGDSTNQPGTSTYDADFMDDDDGTSVAHTAALPTENAATRAGGELNELQAGALGTLTGLCRYSRAPLLSPMRPAAAAKDTAECHHSVQSRLLVPLSLPSFRMDASDKVSLAVAVLHQLSDQFQQLNERHLRMVVDILRLLCKNNFKSAARGNALLEIIVRLLPKLETAEREVRELALHLCDGFWTMWLKGNASPLVDSGISQVLVALSRCDPLVYVVPPNEKCNNAEDVFTPALLLRFLETSAHPLPVCLYSAENVDVLGRCWSQATAGIALKPMREQEELLRRALSVIENTAVATDGYLAKQDAQSNWTAVSLMVLARLATVFPACLRPALFAMIRHGREIPASRPTVRRVFRRLAATSDHPTLASFTAAHVAYVVQQCIDKKFGLGDFLWEPFGETKVEFFRSHFRAIVPYVFSAQDDASRDLLCLTLERPWKELVKECFPHIMTFALPGSATPDDVGGGDSLVSDSVKRISIQCRRLLEEELSATVVNDLLFTQLDRVVVCLLGCLYDGDADADSGDVEMPLPDPPHYSRQVVLASLRHIARACGERNTTLVSLLCRSRDAMQKILLALHEHMRGRVEPHEIRRCLSMYDLFVVMVLEQFDTGLSGICHFFLQDTIHTLTHLISHWRDGGLTLVTARGCQLLHRVVVAVTADDELSNLLTTIVDCLVPVADNLARNLIAAGQALATLNYLVIERGKDFKMALSLVDPFPNSATFAVLRRQHFRIIYDGRDRFSLNGEIQLFLKRLELPRELQRTEGLERLKEMLTRKDELLQLVDEELDESESRLLYNVVIALFRVCESYPPSKSEIVYHAARCLGEIGPIAFPNAILCHTSATPLSTVLMAFTGYVACQRYAIIFHSLHACLIGHDVDHKRIAGKVLKAVLRTKAGLNFAATYHKKKICNLFQYLHPFGCSNNDLRQPETLPESTVTPDDLLTVPENDDYETWLRGVVAVLIDSNVSGCGVTQLLRPICEVQVEFCETLLPYLVHAILVADTKRVFRSILTKWVDNFFAKFCGQLDSTTAATISPLSSQSSTFSKNVIFADRRAIRVLLNVVQHLRLQDRNDAGKIKQFTPWDNNFWLDLNYLNAAKAADHCRAYFTALLFVEIWCDTRAGELDDSDHRSDRGDATRRTNVAARLHRPLSGRSAAANEARDLLLRINQNIGDLDAIHGCQTSRLVEPAVRLGRYLRESRWDRALTAGDLALQTGSLASPETLLHTMHKMGLNHLSGLFFENLLDGGGDCGDTAWLDAIREHQSQCAWKMATWSEPTVEARDTALSFNGCVHQSMLALREDDRFRFDHLSRRGHELVLEQLRCGGPESMSSLREPAVRLTLLNKLADCCGLTTELVDLPATLARKWSDENSILRRTNDGDAGETINGLRCSLLQSFHSRRGGALRLPLLHHLVQQVQLCRENGLLQWAEMYVARLADVPDVPPETRMLFKLEEAKVFWARSEQEAAVGLLGSVIGEMKRSETLVSSRLYGHVLGTYGNWLIETHTENATVVLESFLDKSIEILERFGGGGGEMGEAHPGDTLLDAYLSTARYADSQYKRIRSYVESAAHLSKTELIDQSKAALTKLRAEKARTSDMDRMKELHIAITTLNAQIEIDAREVAISLENERKFLLKALDSYSRCLRAGDRHDTRVFRLISLWFANAENQQVDELVRGSVQLIESRKFLPLIYQLAARMDAANSELPFQITLQRLIERVTLDHPHHALSILFALANSGKDADHRKPRKAVASSRKAVDSKNEQEGRVLAASKLLHQLTTRVGAMITEMSRLCDALIEFSYWQCPSRVCTPISIPDDKTIRKLPALKLIAPLTMNVAVEASCEYDNVPHILGYKVKFKFCGGKNAPKQVVCVGSDGQEHIQLVKGYDDLRQDAVMQQVFGIVNRLLKSNPETRQRQLSIGTYKVVPLTQQSGVLEWCKNTEPVMMYLANSKKNAHSYYNPSDWTIDACREKLKAVAKSTPEEKYATYVSICNHLKPVFHHFFLEKFPHPPVWYERRAAYTKSVATSSIVGYILGLGDRHFSNILIDNKTAQFIHIDLGIAFEQGKVLPTPETVPFRLTRDVIDGMGVMGTEGVFRRCCETTMSLMRESQEVILTILEVFLYDPLYQWTLSPIKVRRLQGHGDRSSMDTNASVAGDLLADFETDANINKLAERVLMRLRDKLEGKEDGTALSVSGHVSHLINEAVDPRNLCLLFNGWQAYL